MWLPKQINSQKDFSCALKSTNQAIEQLAKWGDSTLEALVGDFIPISPLRVMLLRGLSLYKYANKDYEELHAWWEYYFRYGY